MLKVFSTIQTAEFNTARATVKQVHNFFQEPRQHHSLETAVSIFVGRTSTLVIKKFTHQRLRSLVSGECQENFEDEAVAFLQSLAHTDQYVESRSP